MLLHLMNFNICTIQRRAKLEIHYDTQNKDQRQLAWPGLGSPMHARESRIICRSEFQEMTYVRALYVNLNIYSLMCRYMYRVEQEWQFLGECRIDRQKVFQLFDIVMASFRCFTTCNRYLSRHRDPGSRPPPPHIYVIQD